MSHIKTITLGCKVNQYETRYLLEGLYELGGVDALPDQTPDIIVVNTCTVTADSDAKSRHIIRKLHRDYPHAKMIIMGCWATKNPDEAHALAEEAGNGSVVITDKSKLGEWLVEQGCQSAPKGITHFAGHTRAFVKIQDGCKQFCSYCIIPHVRSRLTSRPPCEVKEEIAQLILNGYREIVLTGIHMGFYGLVRSEEGGVRSDVMCSSEINESKVFTQSCGSTSAPHSSLLTPNSTPTFPTLLSELLTIPADFRLRISSLESHEVSEELLTLMRDNPDRICPHLHISMQSGSNAVLKAMNRPTSAEEYLRRCQRANELVPGIAITTDVIVGFPGETDSDFEQTLDVCRQAGFSKIHIFRFSPREGTPAATMSNQIPASIKQERAQRLAELEQTLRQQYFQSRIGTDVCILAEQFDNGFITGSTERYIPVKIQGTESQVGTFIRKQLEEKDLQ